MKPFLVCIAWIVAALGCPVIAASASVEDADMKDAPTLEQPLCSHNEAVYGRARTLQVQKQFKAAIDLAAQVQGDPECPLIVLKAKDLIARIHVFELGNYEEGIAIAKEGLEIDPRQQILWYIQAYAQHRNHEYEEAMRSAREVLAFNCCWVPCDETRRDALYLLSDSVERLLLKEKGLLSPSAEAELRREAIVAWREFQDFCMDADCEQEQLDRAEERLMVLRQLLESSEPGR